MIQTIMHNTDPPVGLWLKTIKRTGKLFIGEATLKEISAGYLEKFIKENCLIKTKVANGIILKAI